jgi:hypothetical protein
MFYEQYINSMNINPAVINAIATANGVAGAVAAIAENENAIIIQPMASAAAPQVNPAISPPPAAAVVNNKNPGAASAATPHQANCAVNVPPNLPSPPALPLMNNVAPAPDNPLVILQYEIEGLHNVETHTRHYATAFCNVIIPLFEAAGDSFMIIDRVKYYRVMAALLHARDGEPLSLL